MFRLRHACLLIRTKWLYPQLSLLWICSCEMILGWTLQCNCDSKICPFLVSHLFHGRKIVSVTQNWNGISCRFNRGRDNFSQRRSCWVRLLLSFILHTLPHRRWRNMVPRSVRTPHYIVHWYCFACVCHSTFQSLLVLLCQSLDLYSSGYIRQIPTLQF